MTEYPIPNAVAALCGSLRAANYEAYPVGGCVRDLLLGKTPGDWDVTTSALPEAVAALFRRTVPTGLKHGTVTVLTGEEKVEVTTFRREGGYADGRHPTEVTFDAGLIEDLSRRDFTVNAMALGADGAIIDPFGGRADLEQGLIRCVGDPDRRFAEDALRMFRAVRFSAQLGFEIEGETAAALRRSARRAAFLSGERIKAELEKILLSPRPERVGELIEAGALDHLFTDWSHFPDFRDVPPEKNLRWRVFCSTTGFPISRLPVERSLRTAVEHPEREALARLAITGGQLCALGLKGREVSALQRRLAAHIMEYPGDNQSETLLRLAKEWNNEREKI